MKTNGSFKFDFDFKSPNEHRIVKIPVEHFEDSMESDFFFERQYSGVEQKMSQFENIIYFREMIRF